MNNQPIGILDSGVGGLSVWKEVVIKLPSESTIYIADSANAPYGRRTPADILLLTDSLIKFLLSKKVKLIIIACNTITVTCLDTLRKNYPAIPIVGTVPVIKTAVKLTKNKKIGAFSTTRTAASLYQKNLINKFAGGCRVYNHGTDILVPLIERGESEGDKFKKILSKELSWFQEKDIDTLVLGCTHFPLFKKNIRQILGKGIKVLDSGAAIARQTKRILESNGILANQNAAYEFYTTGDGELFAEFTKIFIGKKRLKAVTVVKSISL